MNTNAWLRWSVVLCLAGWLAAGCATFPASSGARHPVPAALEWPAYDRFTSGDVSEWSLPTETSANARMGEIWTQGAVMQRDAFWQRVLRDRCASREALQIANGDSTDPDPICRTGERVQ